MAKNGNSNAAHEVTAKKGAEVRIVFRPQGALPHGFHIWHRENYQHAVTGKFTSRESAVAFAKAHGLVVTSDAPVLKKAVGGGKKKAGAIHPVPKPPKGGKRKSDKQKVREQRAATAAAIQSTIGAGKPVATPATARRRKVA
jgi:hypothetical protein